MELKLMQPPERPGQKWELQLLKGNFRLTDSKTCKSFSDLVFPSSTKWRWSGKGRLTLLKWSLLLETSCPHASECSAFLLPRGIAYCPVITGQELSALPTGWPHPLLAKAKSPPARQLLGESPELLSWINKLKEGSSQQWMELCSRSLLENLSFGTWKTFPRRSHIMHRGKVPRLVHSTDLTQNGLGK